MTSSGMLPAEIFSHWEEVRKGLLETIDKFSDDELSFQPFPGSWPVGRIMLHIADTEDYWLHALVQETLPVEVRYELPNYPCKEDIKRMLSAAHERTLALLQSLDETDLATQYRTPQDEMFSLYWIIWHVLEHEIHHRGELSLALGLLGREGLDV